MKTFNQLVEGTRITSGTKVYDVDGKLIGSVTKVTPKLITLSNGDQVNSDSVYQEDGKWIAEL